MSSELVLKFDPNTIEHLGVSLYSQLPSVLAELISNSWDADADNVTIDFIDKDGTKEIIFTDDGEGMTFDELNDKYLVIGRDRRQQTDCQVSKKGRQVIGKKGLGKLSVFGVCDEIEVISVKNSQKNHFCMDLNEIKDSKESEYKPVLHNNKKNQSTSEPSGTILKLKNVRRKTGFDLSKIALSLSKKFMIFDKMPVTLILNQKQRVNVTNKLKFEGMDEQFKWEFPEDKYDDSYEYSSEINGSIITLEKPVKDSEMRGVYLLSRGKLVNTASFYGLRDNDLFHSYVTGYLEVDFIENFDKDVISTDRHSLNWEHDKTRELQDYLQKVIKKIGSEWRKKRRTAKQVAIQTKSGLNISDWQNKLPSYERDLSKKIIDPILDDSDIDTVTANLIIENVIGKFKNSDFKKCASDIADIASPQQIPKFIGLIDEWKVTEAQQYQALAISRIEVIKQFEILIKADTLEVPTLHDFFVKFSWLLDPRILEFEDEVYYSNILKEEFPEEKLEESNKRIDFLCNKTLGDILYVIEIKRSKYRVDLKAIDQAFSYGSFLKKRHLDASKFSQVVCYVIGGDKSDNYEFLERQETYRNQGKVFVKTYGELLLNSKKFHQEFIDTYDKLKS